MTSDMAGVSRGGELLTIAHEMADSAGAAILPHFRRRVRIDNKAKGVGFDPVTTADRAAEKAIARIIRDRLPGHGIEGEEYGEVAGAGRYRWIIDPIDGTRAFILGLPVWGTLIGLVDGDAPVLGMMDQPYTRERFWSTGKTSHFRHGSEKDKRIKTRACDSLAEAMMTTTHPDMFAAGHEADRFHRLKGKVRAARFGGDCYAYCLLAAGSIDLVVEAGLKAVDIAPLIPIIEGAGGVVTSWTGGSALGGGRVVASGDKRLHEKALAVLR
jgi:myo-inositol-1(or 4)-monophosphatase